MPSVRQRLGRRVRRLGASTAAGAHEEGWRQGQHSWWLPPDPPPCPRGWATAPPDFVGVGVARAGTSWWYTLIAGHPDVYEGQERHKELHYFDPYWERSMSDFDPEAYALHFPRPPGGRAGEWTPRYMFDFWAPPMLRAAAPDARLLVLLRDPLERYMSGNAHDLHINRIFRPHVADIGALRGLYHQQLTNLLRFFPRERVLVLQYERCALDARGELSRTFAFLGLDDVPPASPETRVNALQTERSRLEPDRERALLGFLEHDLAELLKLVGDDIDPALWPACSKLGLK